MGVVQVSLPSELGEIIEREVAAGRAPSADAYVAEAVRLYAETEDEILAEAEAGIADIEGGRFTEISSREELHAWGDAALARLRARLADPT
jgi:Arc/MetJ-type ribon-helix-helix transcriptional regulator